MSNDISVICDTKKNACHFDSFSKILKYFHLYFENQFSFEVFQKFTHVGDDVNENTWKTKYSRIIKNPLVFFHNLDYSSQLHLVKIIKEYAKKEHRLAIDMEILEVEKQTNPGISADYNIGKFIKHLRHFHFFFENHFNLEEIMHYTQYREEMTKLRRKYYGTIHPLMFFCFLSRPEKKILFTVMNEKYDEF